MKVPVLLALLFTVVLCRPVRKVSVSSESSEEMGRRPNPAHKEQSALVSLPQSSSVQNLAVSSNSDESDEASEEQVAADVSGQMKTAALSDSVSNSVSDSLSATASTSASTQSPDSEDSEDDDEQEEDDDDPEESETEESESSESGEASTVSTATVSPVIVTDDVTTATIVEELTPDPINPTIITDDTADSGRGDSLGSYPSEYKTIVYVEDKSYHKLPEPHKSWDYTSKKSTYEPAYGNEVHKTFKVYKGMQVNQEPLEEDTSTPEVESQSLDMSSGLPQDLSPRQASLDLGQSSSTSDNLSNSISDSTSDSSGTTEEEQAKAKSISSDSTHEESTSTHEERTSASEESPEGASVSSEETTATPGAADSQSDESDSDESLEEGALQPDLTTDLPVVITAK